MFKLTFDIPESDQKINLKDSILLIGSCFSDEMGDRLLANKLNTLSNPFGTIYNTHSIFKLLKGDSSENSIVESQGVFYHWDAHGEISGLNKTEVEKAFEDRQKETHQFLSSTKWLIITLGTAWVYEYENTGIVANCHKVPQYRFTKRLLSQEDISKQFSELHSYLKTNDLDIHILFTISPVRHIRDGLVENNRSKAILIDAVHSMVERFDNVSYFPSYEIIVDELRDYRFFKEDMIHPSEQTINYVWDRFLETYFDNESRAFISEWNKLQRAIDHKPFQPNSKNYQDFLKKTLEKLEKLNGKIDLSVEIEQLKQELR